MKILFLGFSDILQRKILPSIKNLKDLNFEIASRKKINSEIFKKHYSNYYKAINDTSAKVVYISLINSLHFQLCKYSLNKNKHVIVDKPLVLNSKDCSYLINLAKTKKLLIVEATVFHLSKRFKSFVKRINYNKKTLIDIKFSIPKLDTNNFRNHLKLGGGCFNDMSAYAIKCIDIFCDKNFDFLYFVKKNKKKLNTEFKFMIIDKKIKLRCNFQFDKKYKNSIVVKNGINKIIFTMAFSQQLNTNQHLIYNNKKKIYKNDNTFLNFFKSLSKVLKKKKYDSYYYELDKLNSIRRKIEKVF